MPFFSKSRSQAVYDASSVGSSSASLLIPQEKKSHSSSQKDYAAAFGALSSQYGHSSSIASSQPPSKGAFHISLPKGSQSQSQSQPAPVPSSNVKKIRAKDFGAVQNKYGAIGYGGMASIV